MQQYNMKAFDYNAMLDIQRKNMEAFSEAGKLALEGFQAVMQRQSEIISHLVEDTSSIMQGSSNRRHASRKSGQAFRAGAKNL